MHRKVVLVKVILYHAFKCIIESLKDQEFEVSIGIMLVNYSFIMENIVVKFIAFGKKYGKPQTLHTGFSELWRKNKKLFDN